MDEHEGEIEAALKVPKTDVERAREELASIPGLDPDLIPSAGVEGGGGLSVLVMTLGKAAIAPLASVLAPLASGSDIQLQIGQTTLHAARLRGPNLESLIEKTLDAELRRIAAEKSG